MMMHMIRDERKADIEGCKSSAGEEERVAREKRRDHQPCFAEDDAP